MGRKERKTKGTVGLVIGQEFLSHRICGLFHFLILFFSEVLNELLF